MIVAISLLNNSSTAVLILVCFLAFLFQLTLGPLAPLYAAEVCTDIALGAWLYWGYTCASPRLCYANATLEQNETIRYVLYVQSLLDSKPDFIYFFVQNKRLVWVGEERDFLAKIQEWTRPKFDWARGCRLIMRGSQNRILDLLVWITKLQQNKWRPERRADIRFSKMAFKQNFGFIIFFAEFDYTKNDFLLSSTLAELICDSKINFSKI